MAESSERLPGDEPARRRFFKRLTVALGAAMGAVMTVPLVRYLFFPVGRRVVSSAAEPVDAGPVSALAPGGRPVRVSLSATAVRDAWSVANDVPVGAAWLLRTEAGDVKAFSTVCPHLGCAVELDEASGSFRCPCHTSSFSRTGERLGGPAKRGLDPLPATVERGRVKVTFLRFRSDKREREPLG